MLAGLCRTNTPDVKGLCRGQQVMLLARYIILAAIVNQTDAFSVTHSPGAWYLGSRENPFAGLGRRTRNSAGVGSPGNYAVWTRWLSFLRASKRAGLLPDPRTNGRSRTQRIVSRSDTKEWMRPRRSSPGPHPFRTRWKVGPGKAPLPVFVVGPRGPQRSASFQTSASRTDPSAVSQSPRSRAALRGYLLPARSVLAE